MKRYKTKPLFRGPQETLLPFPAPAGCQANQTHSSQNGSGGLGHGIKLNDLALNKKILVGRSNEDLDAVQGCAETWRVSGQLGHINEVGCCDIGSHQLDPAGETLFHHHFNNHRGYHEYRARKGVCQSCALAMQCTRAKAGRSVNRYRGHELLERARRQSSGPAARRDRKLRQWFQERNFGEAATQHGFKRARWRGLQKQTVQDNLIAALQNFKILLRSKHGGLSAAMKRVKGWLASLRAAFRCLCPWKNDSLSLTAISPIPNF